MAVAGAQDGRVVLVTGAARRVGAAIATELHSHGARVAIHYRTSKTEAIALADRFNTLRSDSAAYFQADLTDIAALADMTARIALRFGRLDALVNSASSFFATPLGDVSRADFDDLVGSNLKGPLFLAQAAAPLLRAVRGCIVNIVDIHAERPLKNYPVYCAAKAGLVGLTRALALELAPQVRVNAVAPGAVLWPDSGDFDPIERRRIVEQSLLKRCGSAADVAAAVRFLVLEAPYVTGQILAVDGGRSVGL